MFTEEEEKAVIIMGREEHELLALMQAVSQPSLAMLMNVAVPLHAQTARSTVALEMDRPWAFSLGPVNFCLMDHSLVLSLSS